MPNRRHLLSLPFGFLLFNAVSARDHTTPPSITHHRLNYPDTSINIDIPDASFAASSASLLRWVDSGITAIHQYYGRFPVDRLHIAITPINGDELHGTTYRGPEPVILLRIGREVDAAVLAEDWVLVHEMVHLAFPPIKRRHRWLEEGLATYVEPLARFHAGQVDETYVWRWLLQGLPQGLPQSGDRGLDFTPSWGRTYWGGALYCLLADLEIRQKTNNRYALRDALWAIVAAGGTRQSAHVWQVTEALDIGDRATGTKVLMVLYQKMSAAPVETNLADLWLQLGVSLSGSSVQFDDNAPQQAWRQALTAP